MTTAHPILERECLGRWSVRVGLLGAFVGSLSCLTVVDLDLFHELALIRESIRIGYIPRHDVFAYTPTIEPVVHHEWGTGAMLYAVCVQTGWGAAGLMTLRYAVSLGIGAGALLCARRRGARDAHFAFLAPLAISLSWLGFTVIRAQLFTLAFLVCLLLLLTEAERGRRGWLPLWLVVHTLWLNMHAGFLVGLGLYTLHLGEQVCRAWAAKRRAHNDSPIGKRINTGEPNDFPTGPRWQLVGLLAMLGLLAVNPYGPAYVPYMWHAVRMPRPLIAEWQPLWSGASWITLGLYATSLALVVYVVVARGATQVRGLILVVVPALLAWQHTRHLSLYAVAWICLTPGWIAETPVGLAIEDVARNRAKALNIFWMACGILGLTLACHNRFWELRIPTTPAAEKEGVPIYPAGATRYLSDHRFQGNLMVPFGAGAFVSWNVYPAVKVSIDSRYEVAYPPGAVEESVAFFRAEPGWRTTLTRYPTDGVLVPSTSRLLGILETQSDIAWRCVYRDDAYALFVRPLKAGHYPKVDRRGEPIEASFP